jgi:hypothetical protein
VTALALMRALSRPRASAGRDIEGSRDAPLAQARRPLGTALEVTPQAGRDLSLR